MRTRANWCGKRHTSSCSSAPQPDLYWGGPVVVLVDQNCASSCEFFTQFLQTNDRVTVVGQYATSGAGAPINRVAMPYGIIFQYTKGRAYFAGTDEMNLEAKGVVPDVRVPVTEESAAALVAGEDPVLAAGLQSAERTGRQGGGGGDRAGTADGRRHRGHCAGVWRRLSCRVVVHREAGRGGLPVRRRADRLGL